MTAPLGPRRDPEGPLVSPSRAAVTRPQEGPTPHPPGREPEQRSSSCLGTTSPSLCPAGGPGMRWGGWCQDLQQSGEKKQPVCTCLYVPEPTRDTGEFPRRETRPNLELDGHLGTCQAPGLLGSQRGAALGPSCESPTLQTPLPGPGEGEARAAGQHRPGRASGCPCTVPSREAVPGTCFHCGSNEFPCEVSWKSVAAM